MRSVIARCAYWSGRCSLRGIGMCVRRFENALRSAASSSPVDVGSPRLSGHAFERARFEKWCELAFASAPGPFTNTDLAECTCTSLMTAWKDAGPISHA